MFDDPRIIHIIVEIVLFGVLIYWIFTMHKKTTACIEEMVHIARQHEQAIASNIEQLKQLTRLLVVPVPKKTELKSKAAQEEKAKIEEVEESEDAAEEEEEEEDANEEK